MNPIKRQREADFLIEPPAKHRRLDDEFVVSLPTDLWHFILKLAVELNSRTGLSTGRSLNRFVLVCKQWRSCCTSLQIGLVNSGHRIANLFATYAPQKLRKNPTARRVDLFSKEAYPFFLNHGASLQALNLSCLLYEWKPLNNQMAKKKTLFNEIEIPFILSSCTNLRELHLDYLAVKNINFSFLSSYSNLQFLSLPLIDSEFDDRHVLLLANCPKLRHLDLTYASITDKSFTTLAALTNLEYLDLTECDKIRAVKTSYDYLSSLNKLTYLDVANLKDGITKECFEIIWHFTSLHTLRLYDCYISPFDIAPYLCSLTSLRSLDVGTQEDLMDVYNIQALASLTQLTHLDVTSNQFDSAHLHLLSQLSQLKKLVIDIIPITDAELIALSEFTSLQYLDLNGSSNNPDNNLFTKAGLNQLKKLPRLKMLDILGETYAEPFDDIPEPEESIDAD